MKILMNLELVQVNSPNEEKEGNIELLRDAPLNKFDQYNKTVYVSDYRGLIEAMKSIRDNEWIGVDMEHTSKYAYHGLLCMI